MDGPSVNPFNNLNFWNFEFGAQKYLPDVGGRFGLTGWWP
jgi:hypothetical protein